MHIRDSVWIDAPPEVVWPWVADPFLQAEWNPKIIACDRPTVGATVAGERFNLIYRMGGREHDSVVTVTECRPPHRLAWSHRFTVNDRALATTEAYVLSPRRGGTSVVQSIDLRGSGIPRVFRVVIWFISRFGRSVGTPYLRTMKQKIEAPDPSR